MISNRPIAREYLSAAFKSVKRTEVKTSTSATDTVANILRQEETAQKAAVFVSKLQKSVEEYPLRDEKIIQSFKDQGLSYYDVAKAIRPHLEYHINTYDINGTVRAMEVYGVPAEVISDIAFDTIKYRLTGSPIENAISGVWPLVGSFFEPGVDKVIHIAAKEAYDDLLEAERYRDAAILAREQVDQRRFFSASGSEIVSLLKGGRPADAKTASLELGLPEETFKSFVVNHMVDKLSSLNFYFRRPSTKLKWFLEFSDRAGLNQEDKHNIGVAAFAHNLFNLRIERAVSAAKLAGIPKEEQKLEAVRICSQLNDGTPEAPNNMILIANRFDLKVILAQKKVILLRPGGRTGTGTSRLSDCDISANPKGKVKL
ncbi:MAG: hypothetical protein KGH94_04700 [Candidatus Micrarchaeota archaeon]|nr:hypothetical protein [Candidatus Micrarchaeota archaeon]